VSRPIDDGESPTEKLAGDVILTSTSPLRRSEIQAARAARASASRSRLLGEVRIGDVTIRYFGEDEQIDDVSVTHPVPHKEFGVCTAWFDGTTHRITSEVPLTISPSLDCPECGWHHSIIEGRVA